MYPVFLTAYNFDFYYAFTGCCVVVNLDVQNRNLIIHIVPIDKEHTFRCHVNSDVKSIKLVHIPIK